MIKDEQETLEFWIEYEEWLREQKEWDWECIEDSEGEN